MAVGAASLEIALGDPRRAVQVTGALVIGTAVAVGTGERRAPVAERLRRGAALVACILASVLLTGAGVGRARRE
jgi:hypothetical protein